MEINLNLSNLVFFSIKSNYSYFNNSNCYKNSFNSLSSEDFTKKFLPKTVFHSLDNKNIVKSYRNLLKNRSGIYSLVNKINGKLYIGSAKDLYLRLFEHIIGKKSNKSLQIAIRKYGLNNFYFQILEYLLNKPVINKELTQLETKYIAKFDFKNLYNFKSISTSMLGYKHTAEALLKMVKRFENKINHPMFGKTHTEEAKNFIRKLGAKNPMFGKKHTERTKLLISKKMKKYPFGVGLYDLNNNLIKKYENNTAMAKSLNISKTTVGKYIKLGKVFNNLYYFKINKS